MALGSGACDGRADADGLVAEGEEPFVGVVGVWRRKPTATKSTTATTIAIASRRRRRPGGGRWAAWAISRSRYAPRPAWTVVSFAYYHHAVPAPPSTADLAGLASQLRIGVTRLARRLRREGDASVTPTLLVALATIERHGPMTAGALAAHEQVRKPTVTRLLASLLDRGLIERTPDPLDGRVTWVHLSSEGRRFLQRVRHRKDEYLSRRLRRLTPDELEILEQASALLERLIEDER